MATDVKFEDSNSAGRFCEERFAKHIVEDLWGEILDTSPDEVFKERDIKALIDWVEVTFEVKSDRKSEYTHNSMIEYEYNTRHDDIKKRIREPSWIASTKADYFVIYSDKKRWQQEVEELRKRLDRRKKRSVTGWNNNNARWRLFKCSEMPELFDQLTEVSELPPYVKEETEA